MADNCICTYIAQQAAQLLRALLNQATGSQVCTSSECFTNDINLFNGGAQTQAPAPAVNSTQSGNTFLVVFLVIFALVLHLFSSARKRKAEEELGGKLNPNHNWRNDQGSGVSP